MLVGLNWFIGKILINSSDEIGQMTSILIWKKIIDKKRGELSERNEFKRNIIKRCCLS